MLTRLRYGRFVRYLVVPVLLILMSGCHGWKQIELGPQLPDRVRVSTTSALAGDECPKGHERYEVYSPRIVGDSLYHSYTSRPIPTHSICDLEERVFAPVETALLSIVGLALVGVIACAAACDIAGYWKD